MLESLPIDPSTPWWYLPLLLSPLVLAALVKWVDPMFMPTNWTAIAGSEGQREQGNLNRWGTLIMGMVLMLSLFLLILRGVEVMPGLGTPWLLRDVWFILGAVMVYQVVRFSLLGVVSLITGGSSYVKRYFYLTFRLSVLSALISSVLLLLSAQMDEVIQLWVVYLCLGVFLVSYVWGFLTALSSALSAGLQPQYIILYLCTLEILPLVVIVFRLDDILALGMG